MECVCGTKHSLRLQCKCGKGTLRAVKQRPAQREDLGCIDI